VCIVKEDLDGEIEAFERAARWHVESA